MIRQILIVIFLVFVGSFDDFAWPADWKRECGNVIHIDDLTETPMGNTIVEISVITTGEYYGSDSSCADFAWCVRKLFDLYPRVLRVEITNDRSEWVPSQGPYIDLCHANLLNEAWEEYGEYESAEAFLEGCYSAQYEDRLELARHD